LRGFFLYASETIENGKDVEVLKTNLKASFWRTLKTILRQNKKAVLLQFLFGSQKLDSFTDAEMRKEFESLKKKMEKKIQLLYDQVNSLQDRISDLETKLTFEETSKYALSRTLKAPKTMKNIQQDNSTLKHLQETEERIHSNLQQVEELISKGVSETYKSPFKTAERSEE